MIPADNSTTLLVVVDAQLIFTHAADPDGRCVGYIARHIDRGGYGLVKYTRFVNRPDSLPATLLGYDKAMATHPKTALVPAIANRADFTLDHAGYGPDPRDVDELVQHACARGIDRAVVMGFDTDACVLSTAFALWDRGLATSIDARGCASSAGQDMHRAALRIARRSLMVSD